MQKASLDLTEEEREPILGFMAPSISKQVPSAKASPLKEAMSLLPRKSLPILLVAPALCFQHLHQSP